MKFIQCVKIWKFVYQDMKLINWLGFFFKKKKNSSAIVCSCFRISHKKFLFIQSSMSFILVSFVFASCHKLENVLSLCCMQHTKGFCYLLPTDSFLGFWGTLLLIPHSNIFEKWSYCHILPCYFPLWISQFASHWELTAFSL